MKDVAEKLLELLETCSERANGEVTDEYSQGKAQAYAWVADRLEQMIPEVQVCARGAERYRWLRGKSNVEAGRIRPVEFRADCDAFSVDCVVDLHMGSGEVGNGNA